MGDLSRGEEVLCNWIKADCCSPGRFKVEMSPINLDRIQAWIDQGRLNPDEPITMKELAKSRCLHGVKRHGVKLLGRVRLHKLPSIRYQTQMLPTPTSHRLRDTIEHNPTNFTPRTPMP
jgi:hypothetical protein